MPNRLVFSFGEGYSEGVEAISEPAERRSVLGGKGAGLAEMAAAGLPVPPGFTLSCEASTLYLRDARLPDALEADFEHALTELEQRVGRRLGDARDPLLVSVRSGAPRSMPGMMDTVLNLGLNDATVEGLARVSGDVRFAWDAYRRFLASFAGPVLGVPHAVLEGVITRAKQEHGVSEDVQLDAEALRTRVVPALKETIRRASGREVPQDVKAQLRMARDAVFAGWNNARAVAYRRRFRIPDDLGTAVTVQQMVFGNRGERSATGVGFTRNPATGAHELYGEFLVNAQGEDVVAGVRNPRPLAELRDVLPEVASQLEGFVARLERTYRWPQDFEFTIEEGRLFLLQTRDGKATARATVRWAVDLLGAGLLDEEEALLRVDAQSLEQLLLPGFDRAARAKVAPVARGLAAGPGAASGRVVFSAEQAVAWAARGEKALLVRPETSAEDVAGMIAAEGVLTATGGMTSHAAVVGRQLGKPCVVGLAELTVREQERTAVLSGHGLKEGDPLSLDGTTGEVFLEALSTAPSELLRGLRGELRPAESEVLRDWLHLMELADRYRRLEVRANADQPRDARTALSLGARGVGLCRTEHMFFERGRLPLFQRVILAAPRGREGLRRREAARQREGDGQRVRRVEDEFGADIAAYLGALSELEALQQQDFFGLLREMRGHPVTVRTLDPPLHEFLPRRDVLRVARESLRLGHTPEGWDELEAALRPLASALACPANASPLALVEAVLARVEALQEANPMMGLRGCRVGITYPEVTSMQARALCRAAALCVREGLSAHPELMIPLVGLEGELAQQRALVEEVVRQVSEETGVALELPVGAMVETPRAALTAGALARHADFFSFGTNDLTQLVFAFSRDDAGRFLPRYLEERLLPADPFATLDTAGVGALMEQAVEAVRATGGGQSLGVCGEHGGDPDSVRFCHHLGLDYVSCSPLRVPTARVAAAQAALEERRATPGVRPRSPSATSPRPPSP
ncbi:MAG: pyruvate, phosphate dikinase [Myxococcaceae bacterium]|nr:pyruvate, phosphate dikinase [Myxococcaceae bacterium]